METKPINKPSLQLDPHCKDGSRRLTEVGAGSKDNISSDESQITLQQPPWWFKPAAPWLGRCYKEQLTLLPFEKVMVIFEDAKIPKAYQRGLAIRWNLLAPIEDDLTSANPALIRLPAELEDTDSKHNRKDYAWYPSKDLDEIEICSIYQLNLKLGDLLIRNKEQIGSNLINKLGALIKANS